MSRPESGGRPPRKRESPVGNRSGSRGSREPGTGRLPDPARSSSRWTKYSQPSSLVVASSVGRRHAMTRIEWPTATAARILPNHCSGRTSSRAGPATASRSGARPRRPSPGPSSPPVDHRVDRERPRRHSPCVGAVFRARGGGAALQPARRPDRRGTAGPGCRRARDRYPARPRRPAELISRRRREVVRGRKWPRREIESQPPWRQQGTDWVGNSATDGTFRTLGRRKGSSTRGRGKPPLARLGRTHDDYRATRSRSPCALKCGLERTSRRSGYASARQAVGTDALDRLKNDMPIPVRAVSGRHPLRSRDRWYASSLWMPELQRVRRREWSGRTR